MEIEDANNTISILEDIKKEIEVAIENTKSSKLHNVNCRKNAEINCDCLSDIHIENALRLIHKLGIFVK